MVAARTVCVYNFSRLRLFCAGSGLTELLCVGKDILPVLDNVGVEENYLFVVCWCYFVLIMNCNHRLGCGVHELLFSLLWFRAFR